MLEDPACSDQGLEMASEGQWGTTAHFSLTDLTSLFAVSGCTCWPAGLD